MRFENEEIDILVSHFLTLRMDFILSLGQNCFFRLPDFQAISPHTNHLLRISWLAAKFMTVICTTAPFLAPMIRTAVFFLNCYFFM